jgi:hypothetical protein
MSAAVSSASAKLPNGVLVSIGDSPGSTENMFRELVYLLGEEAAKAFMSRVRAAFLNEAGMAQQARVNETVTVSSGGGSWNQGGGGGGYQGRPQTSTPQGGNGHYCQHGEMVHKAGISQKNNKPYELWECPQGVCDTQWPPRGR